MQLLIAFLSSYHNEQQFSAFRKNSKTILPKIVKIFYNVHFKFSYTSTYPYVGENGYPLHYATGKVECQSLDSLWTLKLNGLVVSDFEIVSKFVTIEQCNLKKKESTILEKIHGISHEGISSGDLKKCSRKKASKIVIQKYELKCKPLGTILLFFLKFYTIIVVYYTMNAKWPFTVYILHVLNDILPRPRLYLSELPSLPYYLTYESQLYNAFTY